MAHPNWNPQQAEVLAHKGSQLIFGAPGSGKTAALIALAEEAVARYGEGNVTWAAFSFRGLAALEQTIAAHHPTLDKGLSRATIVVHALNQLLADGGAPAFCTNNDMRRILRVVMQVQSFPGTLNEAEHLIKSFKSRAKKVPESEPHYPLYLAYQKQLEQSNMADRHDLVRKHLLAMRGGEAKPLPAKVMLVDNVQDATEIQLLWLRAHVAAGTTVIMAGDDDLTAYGRDGALGKAAISQVMEWPEVATHTLTQTYRVAESLTPVVTKVARMLKDRLEKNLTPHNSKPATLTFHPFENPAEETAWLVEQAKSLAQAPGAHVGLVTRDDFTAHLLTHHLRRAGYNPGSYARPLWEEPAAATVLALLYLMLGAAEDKHLRQVLVGFGIPLATVKELQTNGLTAQNWLARGAPWPELTTLTPAMRANLNRLGRQLTEAQQLFTGKQLNPRTVFKGTVHDLLQQLPQADHAYALLATDTLLSLSGKLTEILPRVTAETMPDATSPIIVAPVREVRNQTFSTLFLPRFHADTWPRTHYPVLGVDNEHERRLFYLALSRAGGNIHISHHAVPSPFVAELETTLAHGQKRKK